MLNFISCVYSFAFEFCFLSSSFSLISFSSLFVFLLYFSLIHRKYVALKQQPKAKEWYHKAAELPFKGIAEEQLHQQAVTKAK
jgi:hypothetical protein